MAEDVDEVVVMEHVASAVDEDAGEDAEEDAQDLGRRLVEDLLVRLAAEVGEVLRRDDALEELLHVGARHEREAVLAAEHADELAVAVAINHQAVKKRRYPDRNPGDRVRVLLARARLRRAVLDARRRPCSASPLFCSTCRSSRRPCVEVI